MFVLTLLLATFLDIFHPAVPTDGLEKKFVVSTITESALTDCATNSQKGSVDVSDPFSIEWPESAAENTANWASPAFTTENDSGGIAPMLFMMPGDPPPPPLPPPVAAVPEPSTVAILGITAIVLLFLLFGRRHLKAH